MAPNVFERFSRDRTVVQFSGAQAGIIPLSWGQKAIYQDMQDSGNQFSMGGMMGLPQGSTIEGVSARVGALMSRHAALRARLTEDADGRLCQEIVGSGYLDMEILTLPDDTYRSDVTGLAAEVMDRWPPERFDFHRDLPLRLALVRHRGECLELVWTLSHLVADGGAHLLLLDDLLTDPTGSRWESDRTQLLDVVRSEQTQQARNASTRAMRYWEGQLRGIPAQTFGVPVEPAGLEGARYRQARFTSPATHLAMAAIGARTGTDPSRVAMAIIAAALSRATGVNPLTVKAMVNNRFIAGFADVIAPLAQNSVLTVDSAGTTVHEVVKRTRGASLSAGMRAYYDPDDLREVMARLDAERGYPATATCRINDQRAMVMREPQSTVDEASPEEIRKRLEESALTWLGPRENMHEQVNILVENRTDTVSLHFMWDSWSLSEQQVEAALRGVEELAVAAALDPQAATGVV